MQQFGFVCTILACTHSSSPMNWEESAGRLALTRKGDETKDAKLISLPSLLRRRFQTTSCKNQTHLGWSILYEIHTLIGEGSMYDFLNCFYFFLIFIISKRCSLVTFVYHAQYPESVTEWPHSAAHVSRKVMSLQSQAAVVSSLGRGVKRR